VTINLKTIPGDEYYTTYPLAPWGQSNWGGPSVRSLRTVRVRSRRAGQRDPLERPSLEQGVFRGAGEHRRGQAHRAAGGGADDLYDQNGYLIWGFTNNLDACSEARRFVNSPIRPLDYYDMSHVYFT